MLADKATIESKFIDQMKSSSYEQYLDAKAEKDRKCEAHANVVRECRRKQQNAYISQKLFNGLRPTSNHLTTFEQIPDDPKHPLIDKENTPKSHYQKRKNDHPLKFDFSTGSSTSNCQNFLK